MLLFLTKPTKQRFGFARTTLFGYLFFSFIYIKTNNNDNNNKSNNNNKAKTVEDT